MFPGFICVSGFATSVVNSGTARMPVGLPQCNKIQTHTYSMAEHLLLYCICIVSMASEKRLGVQLESQ